MNNIKIARNILETANNACDCTTDDYTFDELKEIMQEILDQIESNEEDFYLNSLACGEVRVIHEDVIDELWTEGLIDTTKECYDLSAINELPSFIAVNIDWNQTAENCKVDGKGHHFSSYDGQEHNTGSYYIFRTN